MSEIILKLSINNSFKIIFIKHHTIYPYKIDKLLSPKIKITPTQPTDNQYTNH